MSVGPNSVAIAVKAVAGAERRKLPVPEDIGQARKVRAAVASTTHLPDPERPALPDTADGTLTAIQGHAEALRLADVTRRAAGLFTEEADERYVLAVRAAVPAWIDGLQQEFAALVAVVRKAAAKLPASVDSRRLNWNDPVVTVAHDKASGAVAQLEQLVSDRDDIAKVAGSDGGRDNALFAVAAMPSASAEAVLADRWKDDLAPVLATWKELRQQPVPRWVHLVRQKELTLTLATPGEVAERAAEVERWRNAGHAMRSAQTRSGAEQAVSSYLREAA